MSQFSRVDEAIPIFVKHFQSLYEIFEAALFLLIVVGQEDGQELLETHSLAS